MANDNPVKMKYWLRAEVARDLEVITEEQYAKHAGKVLLIEREIDYTKKDGKSLEVSERPSTFEEQ